MKKLTILTNLKNIMVKENYIVNLMKLGKLKVKLRKKNYIKNSEQLKNTLLYHKLGDNQRMLLKYF